MKGRMRWSYLIILLACGGVVLTATDSWAAVGEPAKEVMARFVSSEDEGNADAENAGETEYFAAGQKDMPTGQGDDPAGLEDGNPQETGETGAENGAGGTGETGTENDGDGAGGADEGEASTENGADGEGEANEGVDGEGEANEGADGAGETGAEPVYAAVEDDYFSDALFIGDSRTVGLWEYGGLEETASFYASTGLTIYKMFESKIVSVPGQKDKITVEQALGENRFGKIYLMIGINEMGKGTLEGFLEEYGRAVEHLKELQPDAVIYVQGIIKVTAERSAKGDYISNEGIEARNAGIAALADNERVFYLDVNPVVCDETGGLNDTYTTDGVHLKAKYIPLWKDFLKQHAIMLD